MTCRRTLPMILLWLSLLASAQASIIDIEVVSGTDTHPFRVEVAADPDSRAQGLMYRTELPRDAGMLFLFDSPARVSFWMRDTLIPLDMLFVREGRILHIHHEAQPHDETRIWSPEPVDKVLEINGGLARELGIRPGDRLRQPPE